MPDQHRLAVRSKNYIPVEGSQGVQLKRKNLQTAHEEADINIVKNLSESITSETNHITIIYDDTDVFVPLLRYWLEYNLTCKSVILETTHDRKAVDIGANARRHRSTPLSSTHPFRM